MAKEQEDRERSRGWESCAARRAKGKASRVVSGATVSMFGSTLARVQEVKPSLHGNVNSGARQVGHCTCAASRNPLKFDRFRQQRRKVRTFGCNRAGRGLGRTFGTTGLESTGAKKPSALLTPISPGGAFLRAIETRPWLRDRCARAHSPSFFPILSSSFLTTNKRLVTRTPPPPLCFL